jgi:hypothetical protein
MPLREENKDQDVCTKHCDGEILTFSGKIVFSKRTNTRRRLMHMSDHNEIPQGTIVLSINKKCSIHHFLKKTPLDPKIVHAFTYKKDHAATFILLAEFAVKTYHPLPVPATHLEAEWECWFGPRKLAPSTGIRDNIRGTIMFPTPKDTFKYEMTGRELFIPELERSFWRGENSAEALAFLVRFAVHTYDLKEVFENNLELGWNGRSGNP